MLEKNAIERIQFEFGNDYIDSRTFFRDIYFYLKNYNFKIYRILRDGLIEIKEYNSKKEIFRNSNFVALKNKK